MYEFLKAYKQWDLKIAISQVFGSAVSVLHTMTTIIDSILSSPFVDHKYSKIHLYLWCFKSLEYYIDTGRVGVTVLVLLSRNTHYSDVYQTCGCRRDKDKSCDCSRSCLNVCLKKHYWLSDDLTRSFSWIAKMSVLAGNTLIAF